MGSACRLDNLVLDQGSNVLAVLDWELSTLGHPIADLAYSAMPYHLPWSKDGTGLQALPKELPEGLLCIFISTRGLKCLSLIPSKVSRG